MTTKDNVKNLVKAAKLLGAIKRDDVDIYYFREHFDDEGLYVISIASVWDNEIKETVAEIVYCEETDHLYYFAMENKFGKGAK